MATNAAKQPISPKALEDPVETRPTQEQIALLAYRLWQERGCPPGSPEEDWFKAEDELNVLEGLP